MKFINKSELGTIMSYKIATYMQTSSKKFASDNMQGKDTLIMQPMCNF